MNHYIRGLSGMIAGAGLIAGAPAAGAQVAILDAGPRAPSVGHQFNGVNLTSHGAGVDPTTFLPSQLDAGAAELALRAWRIPGGLFSDQWHWLNGQDGCAWNTDGPGGTCVDGGYFVQQYCEADAGEPLGPQTGPSFDDFIEGIGPLGGLPIVTLNWEAYDAELLNLVAYANASAPSQPRAGWTTTSFPEDSPDAGVAYFAWLRTQRLSASPVGVPYWELGNEIYGSWSCDRVTFNDPGLYAARAASLIPAIHAIDPESRACMVGSVGSAWNQRVMSDLATAGVVPDCYIIHHYPQSEPTVEGQAEAEAILAEPAALAAEVATIQGELSSAFGGSAEGVEFLMTEFGPSTDADYWETANVWGAIYEASMYAAALQAGMVNADPWIYTQGTSGFSLVNAANDPGAPYAASFFGAELFGIYSGSSGWRVGDLGRNSSGQIGGNMQVSTLRRRYSSSRRP
jgi:hypothetical protein